MNVELDINKQEAELGNEISAIFENDQYVYFKKNCDEWEKLFSFYQGIKKLLENISKLEYDKFQIVHYTLWKLDKTLKICNFLIKCKKSKEPEDTEKIIITMIVSLAEAVYRINRPSESNCAFLVKSFFKPVLDKIEYKIRWHCNKKCETWKCKIKKTFNSVEVLYLIRNDYIHNWNFTGNFFRNEQSNEYVYNFWTFYYSEKDNKTNLILASSECRLTYQNFLNIFLDAFIFNIEEYVEKHLKK